MTTYPETLLDSTRMASAAPANRLWCFLVRQETVQDIFIRAVFGKRRSMSSVLDSHSNAMDNLRGMGSGDDKGSDSGTASLPEPVRIIHKEQDSISAFCLNQVGCEGKFEDGILDMPEQLFGSR